MQETVILPVVVCGFETWSDVSPKGTITTPYITDMEPLRQSGKSVYY